MKIPENTPTFQYYNANPKNRRTDDCMIRALCFATGMTWESVLRELCETAIGTGYDIGDKRCYGKRLEEKGWTKMSQPRLPAFPMPRSPRTRCGSSMRWCFGFFLRKTTERRDET